MFEVEVKIKLRDHKKYLQKLAELGARYQCDLLHVDRYYNMPDGTKDFAQTDEALRIRTVREYTRKNKNDLNWYGIAPNTASNPEIGKPLGNTDNPLVLKTSFSEITYKGPKLDTSTKSRIEYNCEISSLAEMDAILSGLGFKTVIDVRKERMVFHLESSGKESKKMEILVDKIQYLDGFYSELEILATTETEMDTAKKRIFGILEQLGYHQSDSITTSYLELVVKSVQHEQKIRKFSD